MYSILLATHSFWRWLVLLSLVYAIYISYKGWLAGSVFSAMDNRIRHTTATIAQVQLVLGIALYSISPIVRYFYNNYNEAVHVRGIRFFGMEHSLMMFIAVIIITIASMMAKRKTSDKQKFKVMAIGFTIALLVIITNIPWPFSPLVSRPYFRLF